MIEKQRNPTLEEFEKMHDAAERSSRLRRGGRRIMLTLGSLALPLTLWEVAVRLFDIPTFLLPGPVRIASTMFENSSLLLTNTMVTLTEVLVGFGLGVTVGILLGIAIVYSPIFEQTAYPVMVSFQTIPKIALAPLLVVWFGFGLAPKVLVVMLICFFVMVISTIVGMRGVEADLLYLVRSMGSSEWQTFIKIRVPTSLPSIFAGLKVSITQAMVGAIVGEYIAGGRGLGVVQLRANEILNISLQFGAIASIALLGITLFGLVLLAERIAIPWRNFLEEQAAAGAGA